MSLDIIMTLYKVVYDALYHRDSCTKPHVVQEEWWYWIKGGGLQQAPAFFCFEMFTLCYSFYHFGHEQRFIVSLQGKCAELTSTSVRATRATTGARVWMGWTASPACAARASKTPPVAPRSTSASATLASTDTAKTRSTGMLRFVTLF